MTLVNGPGHTTGRQAKTNRGAGDAVLGFEAGPTESSADANVEPDPDTYLPWPDPAKVAAWWAKRSSALARNSRYFLGKPIAADWLRQVLADGRQRQRAAAALELKLFQPGRPLYEVRAPGYWVEERRDIPESRLDFMHFSTAGSDVRKTTDRWISIISGPIRASSSSSLSSRAS